MMKKILLLTALLSIMWGATAQNTWTRAEVTLTLTLHPYLHIEAIQDAVSLDYKTIENHRDGVSAKMHDHLLVHSSSNFEVSAAVRNEHMANKYITITPERSTGTGGYYYTLNTVFLELIPKPIISAGRGHNLRYNITYTGKKDFAYAEIVNKTHESYTSVVVYTIVPK